MDLSAAKVGDAVSFYVDDDFSIVNRNTGHTMNADVVVAPTHFVHLGTGVWIGFAAEHGFCPTGATDILSSFRAAHNIPEKYVRIAYMPVATLIASCVRPAVITSATAGHRCSECNELFEYASHDVSNGKYVCGLCKGRARMFGGA